MKIQIIADSCCDVTQELRDKTNVKIASLHIIVDGHKEYIDDDSLDISMLLDAIHKSPAPLKTAAPSPEAYAELMRASEACVVVTLSAKLSGSYNAAMAGRDMVLEEYPDKKIAVFDSKSAAAAEVLMVLKLQEMIDEGMSFEEICEVFPAYVDKTRTLFVLEDLTTLIKNGRIPKMVGMLATILMFRPIMGENGEGEIIQLKKVRGTQKALKRLVETVAEKTKDIADKTLVLAISHCNCPERAIQVKDDILASCSAIKEVIIQPTRGISTTYANNGGIILAYS